MLVQFLLLVLVASLGCASVFNIVENGAIADDDKESTCFHNAGVMNKTLSSLKPGDTLLVPGNQTFWLMGGIYGKDIKDAVIQIDGTLKFWTPNIFNTETVWPRDGDGNVKECFFFEELENVTFTSSSKGTIDGNGHGWWGAIKYLLFRENRPRLLHIHNSEKLLVEKLLLKDSPYWTFLADDISDLVVRYTDISARRTDASYHDLFDMTAFNTDGFDVSGRNVHIHDCSVWNDDDCIAVKEQSGNSLRSNCSENMLFERINASGVGLTIGSIGSSVSHTCVRNITFKDSIMPNTFKGIYMKSRPGGAGKNPPHTGEITNVTYQNITINNPTQWPIWIGPQQAVYGGACSLLWPEDPLSTCGVPPDITWTNILLKDITIKNPKMSPGVILGNSTNPMKNVVFENVVVNNPGKNPWGDKFYACGGVQGIATGNTNPVPPCFN